MQVPMCTSVIAACRLQNDQLWLMWQKKTRQLLQTCFVICHALRHACRVKIDIKT